MRSGPSAGVPSPPSPPLEPAVALDVADPREDAGDLRLGAPQHGRKLGGGDEGAGARQARGDGGVAIVALAFDWLGAIAERYLKPRGL